MHEIAQGYLSLLTFLILLIEKSLGNEKDNAIYLLFLTLLQKLPSDQKTHKGTQRIQEKLFICRSTGAVTQGNQFPKSEHRMWEAYPFIPFFFVFQTWTRIQDFSLAFAAPVLVVRGGGVR